MVDWQHEHAIDQLQAVGDRRALVAPRATQAQGGRPRRVTDRAALTGIVPRIARRGNESRERLGRYRWVVERTRSWLSRFRRLKVRYERRADIHEAFLSLACALICWKQVC